VIEKQNVRARFEDIALYEFSPPAPLPRPALASAREGCGDALLAAVLGVPGVGGGVCQVHTHKSRVEEDTEINLTEVGGGGTGGYLEFGWPKLGLGWGGWRGAQSSEARPDPCLASSAHPSHPTQPDPTQPDPAPPQDDRRNSALDLFVSPAGILVRIDDSGRVRLTKSQRMQFDRVRKVRGAVRPRV
jgi:hypothetical protein